MFRLTQDEWNSMRSQIVTASGESLRSQIVISNSKGGQRYLPNAFTNLLDDEAAQRKWENRDRIGFNRAG